MNDVFPDKTTDLFKIGNSHFTSTYLITLIMLATLLIVNTYQI